MRLGGQEHADIPVISTGALSLDLALGVGGLPRGRIIEVYGQESSGKTTLALHVVANAQKAGGVAAFIDAEHALDPQYAKKIVEIHAYLPRVTGIERVLGVDERRDAAGLLGVGHDMKRKRRLAGGDRKSVV